MSTYGLVESFLSGIVMLFLTPFTRYWFLTIPPLPIALGIALWQHTFFLPIAVGLLVTFFLYLGTFVHYFYYSSH